MKEKVVGFLILRKPESMGEVEPFMRTFKICGKYYCGVDRSHLNDCIEDYIKKRLPGDLADIVRRDFEESSNSFFSSSFIRNYKDAKKLFDYVNVNDLNELVAFQSERVMDGVGFSKIDSDLITWLGYDLTIMSGGSLIFMGVYFKPHLFSKWIDVLNENGLFDTLDDCTNYFNDYLKAANDGEVEDHLVTEENSEPLKIGRISV